ncbi:MAG: hypothetical protein GY820_32160 [Gammaproteobacteria bacterium]|nr:hypothetical protein [Gammaproteobacteria bacterium]
MHSCRRHDDWGQGVGGAVSQTKGAVGSRCRCRRPIRRRRNQFRHGGDVGISGNEGRRQFLPAPTRKGAVIGMIVFDDRNYHDRS